MARGPGVSYDQLPNGRWRIRWRETVEEDGQRRRVQRSKVVETQASAIEVQRNVLQCIERGQLYEREAVRVIPRVATVDAVFDGWLAAQEARGVSEGSLRIYDWQVAKILELFRELGSVRDGEQVPGEWLTRDGIVQLTNKLRADDYAETTVNDTVRTAVVAWGWASDDPLAYPGLQPAPRDTSTLRTRRPLFEAPPAPTMAECDAVLRRLRPLAHCSIARPAAVLMRCTGLRASQVLSIQARDVMLESGRLWVRAGKSRREKTGRTVPIAPVLVEYLTKLLERCGEPEEKLLWTRKGAKRSTVPHQTLHAVWQAATEAGEVRAEAWAPESREHARPCHAFRAAFQSHLVEHGVRDEVIDLFVGHAGTLRGRHYVAIGARWKAMVEAAALIPAIDWGPTGAR